MTTDRDSIAVVEQHPRVVALGRVNAEREAAQLFASDLAFWLVGGARESLGVLARVVTVVASRELRDPKRMCRGRPLLAVEAAARAAELLWPLLRYPLDESSEESDGEEDSGGEGGGGGSGPSAAGGDVQGQGESSEESSGSPTRPEHSASDVMHPDSWRHTPHAGSSLSF